MAYSAGFKGENVQNSPKAAPRPCLCPRDKGQLWGLYPTPEPVWSLLPSGSGTLHARATSHHWLSCCKLSSRWRTIWTGGHTLHRLSPLVRCNKRMSQCLSCSFSPGSDLQAGTVGSQAPGQRALPSLLLPALQ